MREKLNQSPALQAALIGVLALVVVFLFMTRMGGGTPEDTDPDPGAAPITATDPTAAAGATAPGTTAVPGATATPAPASGAAAVPAESADRFVAGPGLPVPVVKAYAEGKVVVLLVTRHGGIDDRRVEKRVEELRSRADVALFETNANGVADYSQITNGANVTRTPAMVVLKPRHAVDGLPVASVAYGYRGRGSIEQAVRDALYDGRENLPYSPK